MPDPVVIHRTDAARASGEGAPDVLVYATSEETDGAFTLIETGNAAVGSGPPMHIHHGVDETFYVLSGSYRMHVAGADHHCPAGTMIYVPKGTPHAFESLEPGTRKLNLYIPSAMEGFFEELDEIMAAGADPARIVELNAKHETEIIGPIPGSYR